MKLTAHGDALSFDGDLLVLGRYADAEPSAAETAVDAALDALDGKAPMDKEKMFEGFGDFDQSKYQAETEERWGDTDSYKESMRRTKRYTKDDWAKVNGEADGIWTRMVALMGDGVPPESAEAMDLAEEHRLHIDRWFYPCTTEMHVTVSSLYTGDSRFQEYFEKRGTGLAEYVSSAIHANGVRALEAAE